jgi:hypothetical protein
MMTDNDWGIASTTPQRLVQDYPNILQDMADLKYAVLSVSGFYKSEYCREIVARIDRDQTGMVTVKEYQNAAGGKLSLRYIGPGLGQYADDRGGFFEESRLADAKFHRLYEGLPDPRVMVRETIGKLLPGRDVVIADEDGERYGDAVIRTFVQGDATALHRDSAMNYFKGWMVSQFPTQFSALVTYQMSESGGDLSVFKKRWTPEDDDRRVEGSTGYSYAVVDGVDQCTFRPNVGDLYIFHPEVFHDISACIGSTNRINQGIFFAISPTDNRVVTWG